MEVYRVGVKFFIADPQSLSLRDLVPVFHTWIQKQSIPGHLLIDVHDYSHIQGGPGILLVGHEGNFSLDMDGGKPGLLYYRKQPLNGAVTRGFMPILAAALEGCRQLEVEPGIRFRTDDFIVVSNDRLNAPNDAGTLAKFEPLLREAVQRLTPGAYCKFTPIAATSKERFSVRVDTGQSAGVKELYNRL